MPTLFTRIIDGEIPGVFVWRDPECVAFLSINPMHPGHTLVVPRAEVDHWIDLDPDLAAHLFQVAQTIGKAQMAALRRPPHRRDDRGRRGAARPPPRRAVRLGVGAVVRARRSRTRPRARSTPRREDPRRAARPSGPTRVRQRVAHGPPRRVGRARRRGRVARLHPDGRRTPTTRRSSSSGPRATS